MKRRDDEFCQAVKRVSFGYPETEPNRLFWGDNLHVMRQLPSGSLDLIYSDPPFFSGRRHSVVFGDQNERRSFSDIWESGLSGYLIWLTDRLHEMRRLLKSTGSIYVHCDWHASHYIKTKMDKIFGYECFLNDIAWLYGLGGSSPRYWPRKHDSLLWYSRTADGHMFEADMIPATSARMSGQLKKVPDYWNIPAINNMAKERVGYPTQKPEALLERVIRSSCPEGGVVGDFFSGSGTAVVVAQQLGRRWIGCDQSQDAVTIIADRLSRIKGQTKKLPPMPDFIIMEASGEEDTENSLPGGGCVHPAAGAISRAGRSTRSADAAPDLPTDPSA